MYWYLVNVYDAFLLFAVYIRIKCNIRCITWEWSSCFKSLEFFLLIVRGKCIYLNKYIRWWHISRTSATQQTSTRTTTSQTNSEISEYTCSMFKPMYLAISVHSTHNIDAGIRIKKSLGDTPYAHAIESFWFFACGYALKWLTLSTFSIGNKTKRTLDANITASMKIQNQNNVATDTYWLLCVASTWSQWF